MPTAIISDALPYTPEEVARHRTAFHRDGFLPIPGVLEPQEVEALKSAVDRVFADAKWRENHNIYGDFVAVRLFETDPVFEDMLTREPIIGLVESILGGDCHLVAQNVVRNAPGQAIDSFHVDDVLYFPIGEGMARHDTNLTMPVHILTVQILLTDVPSVEYGPSQYIPGSHYSGRHPDDPRNPSFEGKPIVSVLGRAGDIYLHNGQCWHRGAPNASDRVRYLFQLSYGARWVSQRFYPFVNYQLPRHIHDRADERRRRVLGFHPKGAYG
ncbi:MAG: phytanoyl-CoA dioxygenase family protein [Armatimonadetes bacterium]|nr:phytanoyl-CoA dioxygenase family protein [Armatimonadota bacterium]